MAAKPAGIESLLECCICLGDCQDPRLLPCAHSLCKQCLEDHIRSSAQGGHYQCPSCRNTSEVPQNGASGVPKNFFLNNLREILQSQKGRLQQVTSAGAVAEGQRPECSNKHIDFITHASVTAFCVQCSKYLCSSCEHIHLDLVSESHELQPFEGVAATGGQNPKPRRSKPKPRCDQHAALHNDMYCDTCHVTMCMKCCLLKHKQHDYRELDDLIEEAQGKLAKLSETAKKRYNVLEKHLKKLDVTQEKMDKDANKACRQVNEATKELVDLVTKRNQSLIKEIKDIHAVAATELKAAHKETELSKASVQSLLSYMEALQTSGDVSDQVVHTPGLQEQLRQQETSPLTSVSWTVDFTENVASVNALLGSVSKKQTVDRPASLTDYKKVKLGSPLLTLTPNICDLCAGITKIDDCLCVVGWDTPHLWLHNSKTSSSKQHRLGNLRAAGMTTVGNNSNTLAITDRNNKLHLITINPQNMSITKKLSKDISFQPGRVVYDHTTDRLIIANLSHKQIVICCKTGDIENRITVNTEISDMWCVLPTAGDAYIVLDYSDPGRVLWVNQSGDFTCAQWSAKSEHFCFPVHMLQDSKGRLLVADISNCCIPLINNRLITASDGMENPSSLYLDETAGMLYAACSFSPFQINMYKWPFTSADTDTLSKSFKLSLNLGRYQ